MKYRVAGLCLALFGFSFGAEKKPPVAKYSDERVELTATAFLDKDSVREVVGAEMQSGIFVVELSIQPVDEKPLRVYLDDFTLLSHKDGQKSQPLAPSQIAGSAVLVVSSQGSGGGPLMGGNPGSGGPIILNSPTGRPRRIGEDEAAFGTSDSASSAKATIKDDNKDKENPLLAILKEKVLPEKETTEEVTGLLYFPIEGKHKGKDLRLLYRGHAGRFDAEFREQK